VLYTGDMRCKKTIDARSFSHQTLEEMRTAAVERVEAGESPEAVATGLGINRRTIYRWLASYSSGGIEALKAKPIPGAPPKLNAKQTARLCRLLHSKNPLQLKFEFALWTLSMIRELIHREFGIEFSESGTGRLLRRLGFTPQRPLYQAWQQNPVLVEQWREEEFPKIAARAKQEGALIFFGDESGIRSDYHAGTTWSPRGQTPIVKSTGARFSFNMLSAVNALGQFRFMTHDGSVTARVFRDFLKRLTCGMDRKIFLIVDGHPAHKAKMVQKFVEENSGRIELFFLPPYSPELNPDELAWAHVKRKVARATAQTKTELKAVVGRAMRSLQKTPQIVAGFFSAPSCAYASSL
jgi:transposase